MRMDSCMSITVGKQLSVSGNKFRGSYGCKIHWVYDKGGE